MSDTTNEDLSIESAYRAMLAFLESYYDSTKSDEVGGMLGGMSLNSDGKPMDPAYWSEWLLAVRTALETNAYEDQARTGKRPVNKPPYFIESERLFGQLQLDQGITVQQDIRLPRSPFQEGFKVLGFQDLDWLMSDESWPSLQGLASQSDDQEIVFSVFEPDPTTYFKAHFGYYSWAKLPTTMTAHGYWEFLNTAPGNNPADSILANAQVVAYSGPSKTWAVWGERASNICIVASRHGYIGSEWNDLNWVSKLHGTHEWIKFSSEIAHYFRLGRR